MTIRPIIAAFCALMALGPATAQVQDPPPPPVQEKDIFDTAVATESLKTFSQVVEMAGLKDTLKSKGEKEQGYTVFAPTEAAFSKLPKPVLEKLLEDKALLKQVLQYHVLAGRSVATDLENGKKLKTMQNDELTVKVEDGTTWINGAKVVAADTLAINGIVHQIDIVLIPPSLAARLGVGRT